MPNGGEQVYIDDRYSQYPKAREPEIYINKAFEPSTFQGMNYYGENINRGYGGYKKKRNVEENGSKNPADKSSAAYFYSGK